MKKYHKGQILVYGVKTLFLQYGTCVILFYFEKMHNTNTREANQFRKRFGFKINIYPRYTMHANSTLDVDSMTKKTYSFI